MKMNRMAVLCAGVFGLAALAAAVYSQEKKEAGDAHKIVHYGDLKWTPIMKGCELAAVYGDPTAEGEAFDETKLQTMNVGNFILMPKEMRHFAMNKGETIVQIHGAGPFKVNWVNPSEVPPPDAPATPKPKS